MLDTTRRESHDEQAGQADSSHTSFRLGDLKLGETDKLGDRVEEIYCLNAEYAIYRSTRGVHVHFSDDEEEEKKQRKSFTAICPELCELRYLSNQMRARGGFLPFSRSNDQGDRLFAHNMAQALLLVLEGELADGKKIAEKALAMAVRRVTTENTIRYVRFALVTGFVCILLGALLLWHGVMPNIKDYIIAGLTGAIGAVFSVASRLEAFQLKPCDESVLNRWMAGIRVGVGVAAGMVLLLLASTVLRKTAGTVIELGDPLPWESAAILGILGGFAERLIPNLLRKAADGLDPDVGTPVQAARRDRPAKPAASAPA